MLSTLLGVQYGGGYRKDGSAGQRQRQMMTSAERAGGVSCNLGPLLCVLGHF